MLIIDTREPQSDIWDIFARLDISIPDFRFEKLDFGDYLLDDKNEKILIERKEVGDFCATYGDLKDRLDQMREKCDRTALLLEGQYSFQNGSVMLWRGNRLYPSMSHRAFLNFIASQQARGSYFYRTNNLTESIILLCYLHEYLPTIGKRPVRKTKSAVEWFTSLPGVGLLTAFGLREDYKSPDEALHFLDDWAPPKTEKMLEKW